MSCPARGWQVLKPPGIQSLNVDYQLQSWEAECRNLVNCRRPSLQLRGTAGSFGSTGSLPPNWKRLVERIGESRWVARLAESHDTKSDRGHMIRFRKNSADMGRLMTRHPASVLQVRIDVPPRCFAMVCCVSDWS